jgi:DNA invertase Pin-like site-specific DNA recombinase
MNQEWNPTKALRLALYARVSSERQAEERTIDSQVSLLRERIAADGGVIGADSCLSMTA